MVYVKEKYPCGYEIEVKGMFFYIDIEDDGEGCPLHGKECYKEIQKDNEDYDKQPVNPIQAILEGILRD